MLRELSFLLLELVTLALLTEIVYTCTSFGSRSVTSNDLLIPLLASTASEERMDNTITTIPGLTISTLGFGLNSLVSVTSRFREKGMPLLSSMMSCMSLEEEEWMGKI